MISGENLHNMRELFEALEAESGSRVLIKYMQGEQVIQVTAPAFFQDIRAFALRLRSLGPDCKHIGVTGKNSYEWLVAFYAVLSLGAVAVLIGQDSTVQELEEAAVQADLDAIVYDETMTEKVERCHMVPANRRIPMLQPGGDAEVSSFSQIAAHKAGLDDLACIFFTSGTTAKKKAVMLSHRGIIAGVCNEVLNRPFHAQLAVLPFHHLAGFNATLNTLCLGGILCIAGNLKYLYRYLEQMQPDYLLAVPSMIKVIVRRLKKADAYGASLGWNLRILSCGGAKFQPEIVEVLVNRKITIMQSYGASEAGGLGFSWEMTPENPDTIGKAPPEMEAKIVDGELVLRSASVMMGYYRDPEATAEVLQDGWYYTGDLCRMDEKGYLYLTGRKKNLIVLSNGENISPEEIETKLSASETVAEVLVSEERDFLAATFVPQYPSGCTEADKAVIQRQINKVVQTYNWGVPAYKAIQFVHFRETPFEKNAVGKMIRPGKTGGKAK